MRLAIIGAGSWGTAVASLAAHRGRPILWARRPELADAINSEHRNNDYLSAFDLPPNLRATSSLSEALADAEVVVMAVPSHGFRAVLHEAAPSIGPHIPVLSLTKGIEQETLMRMTEVTADVLDGHDGNRIGVLSGPNLAREIMAGEPAATVIAMRDVGLAAKLQTAFMTPAFRVYTNPDVVGAETAGAVKNAMAIAAGIVRGMGFGMNTLSALITRALAELARLGIALGGDPLTFGGLAGVGDLIATCMSPDSRNNRVGFELGRGRELPVIIEEMNMVAEGVKSTSGILALAAKHGVEMPIAAEVGKVLYEGASPQGAVASLMGREAKAEGHGIVSDRDQSH